MEFKKHNFNKTKKPIVKKKNVKKEKDESVKLTKEQKFNEFKARGLTILQGKKKKFLSLRNIIVIVVLVLVISFALIALSAPTGIVEYISTKTALMKSGEAFPVTYDFSPAKAINYNSDSVLVATETELKCYNNSGNLIYSRIHGFEKPVIKTSKIRNLIYGLNESFYRIETPRKEVINKKTANNQPVIAGDIADCGVYVLATESDDDIVLVTVYDKNGSEIYKYHSSNNYVTGVTLSENGKKVCIATVTTSKAVFESKVLVFDLKRSEPIYEKKFKDEIIFAVEYSNSSDICVITDKNYRNIDDDEITEEYSYKHKFLNKFEISEDNILLYITADSNSSNGSVVLLSPDGDEEAVFQTEGTFSDISVYDDRIFALGEKVFEYNTEGKKVKTTKIKSGAVAIQAMKKGCAVLYSTGVDLVQ